MNREQFDQAYTKDKHSSVRILFQETFAIGSFKRPPSGYMATGGGQTQVLCPVVALYVMDLEILCVDARVMTDDGFQPHQFAGKSDKRLLETHLFPAAVRRSIVLADQLKLEFSSICAELFTDQWTPAP